MKVLNWIYLDKFTLQELHVLQTDEEKCWHHMYVYCVHVKYTHVYFVHVHVHAN